MRAVWGSSPSAWFAFTIGGFIVATRAMSTVRHDGPPDARQPNYANDVLMTATNSFATDRDSWMDWLLFGFDRLSSEPNVLRCKYVCPSSPVTNW